MKLSTAWRRIKRRILPALVFGAMLVLPSSASAAVLTYYPSGSAAGDNDLDDLNHQFYYAWTITGIPTVAAGQQITSAYLTFKNLYNWNTTANMLFLDLSDKVSTGGTLISSGSGDANGGASGGGYTTAVRSAQDSTQVPVTTIDDAFDSSNSLLPTTNKIHLSQHAFLPGDSIDPTYNDPSQSVDITWLQNLLTSASLNPNDATFGATNPQWSFAANGTGFDYTYQFTSSQLSTLTSYINGSGTDTGAISIAFDPDCHFYNDGVSFTMVTGNQVGGTAVPEPASLMLLGTGLLLSANSYRRRRAKKAAK